MKSLLVALCPAVHIVGQLQHQLAQGPPFRGSFFLQQAEKWRRLEDSNPRPQIGWQKRERKKLSKYRIPKRNPFMASEYDDLSVQVPRRVSQHRHYDGEADEERHDPDRQ